MWCLFCWIWDLDLELNCNMEFLSGDFCSIESFVIGILSLNGKVNFSLITGFWIGVWNNNIYMYMYMGMGIGWWGS
jgi:hypothetical protein